MHTFTRFGVPYYWIMDPEHQTIDSYHLEGGHYTVEASNSGEDIFRSSLFPGLEIPLTHL